MSEQQETFIAHLVELRDRLIRALLAIVILFVCLMRAIKGHFTPTHHFGFEAAAWYWHFVDVVWLFLFIAVYIWGAGGAEYAHH